MTWWLPNVPPLPAPAPPKERHPRRQWSCKKCAVLWYGDSPECWICGDEGAGV